ncbi:MAG: MlaE family lipid ABC transporter permease subunit [Candidatus Scalindua sp. AMX11]|nr:MAG: MlaE family lipid ABC transporter permease subunit [Candidatus Scalindua sp.]NOG86126.1 MlaE family lipid ABC transporter permease subunit [Planctomycetota bacterium]RZV98890.1 MAG: MlaE family lipid ABC transporter permease subunit [Candidatus Scalindua sp. SCAELEC01]TDE66918.1 MAG: MlaE family lipid ABC transporter permease subunit [Candidatus Scalindua sp. AMX11]GJQ57723.1 MAG: glycoprotein endopeptidase metalloprotease [Candidatus Scalindua sp.]
MTSPKIDLSHYYRSNYEKSGTLTIYLYNRLCLENTASLIKEFTSLIRTHQPTNLVADLKNLDFLDDFGVALFVGLRAQMGERRGTFSFVNINEIAKKVLSMNRFDSFGQQTSFEQRKVPDIFTRLGDTAIEFGKDQASMFTFLGDTFLSFFRFFWNTRMLRINDVMENMHKVGLNALPIVGLISFLLGLIMAFMSSVQLQQFGANIYVASLVSLSMTRELGPIMTAIIVAGRSASAFAAEIGTMKISEEIDALFTMGIDPHIFLVLPRIIATCLVVPLLVLFSDLFAILGGLVVGTTMLDLTINGYITQTINTLSLYDVFFGVFKSIVFALLISWIGCLRGFQAKGGATSVGRATTSAVVSSIFLIVVSDSIFVVILRYWEG